MKVKLFTSSTIYAIEAEMNKWLEDNRNIKIVSINQTSGMNKFDSLYTVISVFYKPKYKKQDTGPK